MEQHEFARAIQHYKRARGIFHCVSNNLAVGLSELGIREVDRERREEERKGVSSRQDVLS